MNVRDHSLEFFKVCRYLNWFIDNNYKLFKLATMNFNACCFVPLIHRFRTTMPGNFHYVTCPVVLGIS